jgi:hypothetical protein
VHRHGSEDPLGVRQYFLFLLQASLFYLSNIFDTTSYISFF